MEGRKQICPTSIHDLANTDELVCQYRSFPSRTLCSVFSAHYCKRVKDRLTAVLTMFADGKKAPLTITGRKLRPCSFPRIFNPLRELNVFQITQKNSWNTKGISTRTVEWFDKMGRLEGRKLKVVLHHCSAHLINYEYDIYEVCLLPPNPTSHVQPVHACVGRSFKCSSRRLICRYVLRQVDKLLELPAEERPTLKLSDVVTLYDAFELMAEAWNRVPKREVLKSWLKSDILDPHQIQEVKDIMEKVGDTVENAISTRYSSAIPSELVPNKVRATTAKNIGDQWLETKEVPDTYIDDDQDDVYYENITLTADDLEQMKELPFVGELSAEDLQDLLLEEELEPATEVVEEGAALSHAAKLLLDNSNVGDELEEDSDGERDTNVGGSEVEERVSLKKYIEHIEDRLKLLSSLVRFEDDDAGKEMLIKFRDNAVREKTFLEQMRKAEKKQGTLHGFFGMDISLPSSR